MNSSIRLGRILGIPLGVNYSWFIVFLLVAFSLAHQFGQTYQWSVTEQWGIALATSLLFFGSVLAHELAHSVVAISKGIPVKGITLFIFGGVSQISREATTPASEFLIAIVGPLTSLALGGLFFALFFAFRTSSEHLAAMGVTLGWVNVALVAFNLIPGFPLDGGRVFRAMVWRVNGDYRNATRIAASLGRMVGILFIAVGVGIVLLVGNLFQGVWLAFIGWFLESAASSAYKQLQVREALKGYVARDLMVTSVPSVPGDLLLSQLVEEHILPTGTRWFAVTRGGHMEGLITLASVKGVPREEWPHRRVEEVMVPLERAQKVAPGEDVYRVMEIMGEADVNQVPVVQGDTVLGFVTRERIVHFLTLRADLGV